MGLLRKADKMKELKVELENCYGIQKLNMQIDYSNKNVAIIYAPNGTMKSSLAKTFEAIRDNKPVEEKVYGFKSLYNITDEKEIKISNDSIIHLQMFFQLLKSELNRLGQN